jgi:UDPglucose 6-dehydrogenase
MNGQVLPLLERVSGKSCGRDFGLCYNPEFIALGNVIGGLLSPDFILIGESDSKAGEALANIHKVVCTNSPPIERMSYINAEITKISVNSFVTMKMSFANTIAEICEKTAGADVDRITSAIGKDKRIGQAYLRGALGYGGPCFPRDNVAFSKFASRTGAQAELARTTHHVNLRQIDRVVDLIKHLVLNKQTRIGILGLSYKPNTNVVDESQSLILARRLAEEGFDVHVHDPASMANAKVVLGSLVKYETKAEDCVANCDVCVIATPWSQFARLNPRIFRGRTVVDCWRLFDHRLGNDVTYVPLGRFLSYANYPPRPKLKRRIGRTQAILS